MKRAVVVVLALVALTIAAYWLGTWAGRERDRTEPPSVDDTVVESLLGADPTMPLAAGQTDVVLAVVCTLRKDRLEPYGADRPTSPFLSMLSEHGVTFDRHFAQAPWTRPSMGSIVTGRWPRGLQLDSPSGKAALWRVLDDGQTTLAEALSARGYATFASTGNPNVKARFGFTQGFDDGFEPELTWSELGGAAPARDADQVDAVLAWASRQPADRPLYVRTVFISTHRPRHYDPDDLALFGGRKNPRVAPYEAAVRSADAQLARLYAGLAARRRNLLFVVVADHGEGLRLPRHHGSRHGATLYQTIIHVPWLVWHPSLPAGRRVSGLTMNIDLHPTVLDLLGIGLDHPVDGASQAEVVRGQRESTGHDAVFSESYYKDQERSTVLDARWQLLRDRRTGQEQLFAASDWKATDEVNDPAEKARLHDLLDAWEAERTASVTSDPVEVEADEGTRRQLEALGYTE